MNRTHELKTLPKYFVAVAAGRKTFEIRKNDRNFQVGDKVILKEWDGIYTGQQIEAFIIYMTDYEQKENYVVFSMQVIVPESEGDENE